MTRPLFCFCAAFALGCIASQYFLAPALWLPAAGIVLVLGALGLLLRGPMRRRVLLCALGMAFAFGWNAAYTRFIAAPNEALIGAAEDVELELCSYAVETNYGAKATVRILGRGLRGRAVYYGGFDLLALEPGEHVRDTVLFNSATDPSGDGSHIRNFTSKGVYLLLYSRGEPSYETGDAGALRYAPQRIAEKLGETIETVYGEREGGFLRALLLGDKRYLDVEDSSNLSEAGIYHITAVSGLHCMFLVELLDRLLRASHRRTRCAVTIPLLFLYAVMVGASPSILRACVMLSMTQLAPLFRREKDAADGARPCIAAHFAQKSLRHCEHQLTALLLGGGGPCVADAEDDGSHPHRKQAPALRAHIVRDDARGAGVLHAAWGILFRLLLRRFTFE